jgi:hypothetical protein
MAARQGRNQRRKTGVIRSVRIGTDLEQRTDKGEWAVVDRILKAVSDGLGHWPIWHAIRIIDSST